MARTTLKMNFTLEEEKLSQYAKALGHPVRIQILNILSEQSCCYNGDLTEIIPLAQSTISQHLKSLNEAGLIQGEIIPPKINIVSTKIIGRKPLNYLKSYLNPKKHENH